ncbi:hypothetical protein [Hyphomonas sp. UBA4494]|jgi:hypothetical protein|uniref:hypothetical protein n=1 Tax=Hyphomonas sp. UBA4494 TaxID=1946631 RepID=UPI0025C685FE|nr:hypothetical protein [Hyphomonas sp. UBA4494]
MIIAAVISLLCSFAVALVLERALWISETAIEFATSNLPYHVKDERREQWISDIQEIEGSAWQIVTALGIVWTCRIEICERFLPVKLPKKYYVCCIPSLDLKDTTVISWNFRDDSECRKLIALFIVKEVFDGFGSKGLRVVKNELKKIQADQNDDRNARESDKLFSTNVLPTNVDAALVVVDGVLQIVRTTD